jgi:predicted DNA-binding protein (MmcQ/YjbR family)
MEHRSLRRLLVGAGLSFPGAYEDFPWGERVAKVNKKIFTFLGADDAEQTGMAVRLPDSCDLALSFGSVLPSNYGLARAGWVRVNFTHQDCPPVDLLLDWLDESYRAVAPKRLVAELDKARDDLPRVADCTSPPPGARPGARRSLS